MTVIADGMVHSLHTVTRSYRHLTCFPIIRSSLRGTAPTALFSFYYDRRRVPAIIFTVTLLWWFVNLKFCREYHGNPPSARGFPLPIAFLRIQFTIGDVEAARPMVWEICGRDVAICFCCKKHFFSSALVAPNHYRLKPVGSFDC